MTHRISLDSAVCPVMCPKFCVPSAAPLCPPAGVTRLFPHWWGAQKLLHHWGGGCRQGGDTPTAPLQEMAHPAAGHTWGGQPAPGGLCPGPMSCCQRSMDSPRGLQALVATLGALSRSHTCAAPRVTTQVQLLCHVTVGQAVPAAASPLGLSKARAVWPLIMSKNSEATVGLKSCAVPRAAFLSSATLPPPQALKHRANIWQGRLQCWGPWWALDPCRGLCCPAQYEISPAVFLVSMVPFERWRTWWLSHGAELLLWQPALTLPTNHQQHPARRAFLRAPQPPAAGGEQRRKD